MSKYFGTSYMCNDPSVCAIFGKENLPASGAMSVPLNCNMMYTTVPVMKRACDTRIYLRLHNESADIPIYLCTVTACPSALSINKTLGNVTIIYLENGFKLYGSILISWHGTQLRLFNQRVVYNFPCRVHIPIGQGSHVKLLLNRNYQIPLLSGNDNFHIPMRIATESQQ